MIVSEVQPVLEASRLEQVAAQLDRRSSRPENSGRHVATLIAASQQGCGYIFGVFFCRQHGSIPYLLRDIHWQQRPVDNSSKAAINRSLASRDGVAIV